ncbi:MAG: nodulation protein NfeD [candidate division KSB1 bacterium]|nr:nodulation protein NfeD [candidate division KSB1 bacterium]
MRAARLQRAWAGLSVFAFLGLPSTPAQTQVAEGSRVPTVHVIDVDGIINPVSAQYILRHLEAAEEESAECLIIRLDTPGGLLESTKDIVKKMLSANVPVVVYVSPSGAGAVSAGVFITLAAHIAAMDEGTNIGAAHPVSIGGTADTSRVMEEKITNWAVAYIRSIAEKRGRNPDWAEQAVRRSVSCTEKEALRQGVIDLIAPSLDSLLVVLDGRQVQLASGPKVLRTRQAKVVSEPMTLRDRILYKISHPTVAYILLILGIYGLFFELSNPGAILPGVVGGIFLILAFFALQTLSVNYAGLLLILFAIVLFILEVKVTSYGILTLGGIVSMIIGSLMLFNTYELPALRVSVSVVIAAAITTAAFFVFALGMALKAKRAKPTTGREGLIGEIGLALTRLGPEEDGQVKLHGEIWRAMSDQPIRKGDRVRVVSVEGLTLRVEPVRPSATP